MKKIILISIIYVFVQLAVALESTAIWAPIWDINTPKKITKLVEDAAAHHIDTIIAEVRYRGDTLYQPNKHDSTYTNNEKKCYILKDKKFDPLDDIIKKAKVHKIKVIAWATVFVITPYDLDKLHDEHVFFNYPQWVTFDSNGNAMQFSTYEGIFLDPGVPAVQDYTFNVLMDIVANYPVHGIQLDYMRYPDAKFGYNPLAVKKYKATVTEDTPENWQKWKEAQLENFLLRVYAGAKKINRHIEISATAYPDLQEARQTYGQNWLAWLGDNHLDKVYLMAYTKSDEIFRKNIDRIGLLHKNRKIVVGLRAWSEKDDYFGADINRKIAYVLNKQFSGISLFSYAGIITGQFWDAIDEGRTDNEN